MGGSDHNAITMQIKAEETLQVNKRTLYNTRYVKN